MARKLTEKELEELRRSGKLKTADGKRVLPPAAAPRAAPAPAPIVHVTAPGLGPKDIEGIASRLSPKGITVNVEREAFHDWQELEVEVEEREASGAFRKLRIRKVK